MLLILCTLLPAANETVLGGQVIAVTKTRLNLAYLARDGRTLRVSLKLTDKTEAVRDGEQVPLNKVAPGTIVKVTITPDRTILKIALPDTPPPAPEVDEEVFIDGETGKVNLDQKDLVIEKVGGKKLTLKLDDHTEVRLDGAKKDLAALKEGQTVRVGVYKKARTVTRIFIYDLTERK